LQARCGADELVDTPGIYGLSRLNEEERVALAAISEADCVVNVIDGTHLARDLFLTKHLIDAGLPLIVAVNFTDEMRKLGISCDWARFESALNVPVVPVSAATGEGMEALKVAIQQGGLKSPRARALAPRPGLTSRLWTLLWYEEDPQLVAEQGSEPPPGSRDALYIERRQWADQLATVVLKDSRRPRADRLGRFLLTPWGGAVALVVVLAAVYGVVGVVVADGIVSLLEAWVQNGLMPWVTQAVSWFVPPGSIPYRLLVGEYGVISSGLTYLVALLLPLVVAFYAMLAALEDSGYLPRLAILLDRFFLRLGLNGRAVIPLVLGFGCVTMATMTTRILGTERERSIATILLAWTIPCSAQMGVIMGLLSGLGWPYALAYAGIILSLFIAIGTVLDRTLPGQPSPLLLDLPPMRWPSWANLVTKTRWKAVAFLQEAGPLFLAGALGIELANLAGVLPWLSHALAPFLQRWLGIPGSATPAFLLGFIRRDFGAVGLYVGGLNPRQILTGAVTLTLFVPCIASTLVIVKERGWRAGGLIWLGSIALALAVGGLTAHFEPASIFQHMLTVR
jgi:ferrous iron transport protein B